MIMWLTAVTALVGALAWLPEILRLMKPVRINGRLVSWAQGEDFAAAGWDTIAQSPKKVKGILFMPRIALTATNGNHLVSRVEVRVRFAGDGKYHPARLIGALQKMPVEMKDGSGSVSKRLLRIPPKENVASLSIIRENDVTVVFVPFVVDKATFSRCSRLQIQFYDFKKKCRTVDLDMTTADPFLLTSLEEYCVSDPANSGPRTGKPLAI
jgi:hypothetical protein